MFVLGTAGHVDHGKSMLVRALTGMDPDRLREEKERGMTIDLGFAWLKLPSGREVGIVDVPGHERFIKNMLAGVGGIDLALFIVAANEGVMPQTREHLAVLDLLEVQHGIVVVTKKDMVEEEWLDLVKVDIEELIAPTTLAGSPIIAVSSTTGEGLPGLVAAVDGLLSSAGPKKDLGRPRLPIDRIFTTAGAGTVVTGTLIDGMLHAGQEVEIVPPALKSRLRALQTHRSPVTTALPGSRVAANLTGVATSRLKRGDVLTTPGWLAPSTLLTARVRLLPHLRRPLKHDTVLSFHTGAGEVMARIRLLDREQVHPGEVVYAQLRLREPVAVVSGDHYVIRSPVETLGGGKIVEANAVPLRRFRTAVIQNLAMKSEGTAAQRIMAFLETNQPVTLEDLLARCRTDNALAEIDILIRQRQVVALGEEGHRSFITLSAWERMSDSAAGLVEEYHRKFPLRDGMPKVDLASRLKLGIFSAPVLQRLALDNILEEQGTVVRLPGRQVKVTPEQQARIDEFLHALEVSPYSPQADLIPEADLLNLLIDRQKVVKISDTIVLSTVAHNALVKQVATRIREQGSITLAEARDMFGTSRKYAQAFLEHLDENRITLRLGDKRFLCREQDDPASDPDP